MSISEMPISEITIQQVNGVRSTLNHLLPGCRVAVEVMNRDDFLDLHEPEQFHERSGKALEEHEGLLWVKLPGDRFSVFSLKRNLVPFSAADRDLLVSVTDTLGNVQFVVSEHEIQQAELVANPHAFELLLVARYLRGELHEGIRFWTPEMILSRLQDLAFRRYEQQATTSGLVVAAQPEAYVEQQVDPSCYTFEAFPDTLDFQEQFFAKPASHRYVDGRNVFYLIDHDLSVHGLLRCEEPSRFDRSARAANEHLDPLLTADASEVWACYVGENDDLNAVVTKNKHLRWLKSHWHFVDQYHLSYALEQHGFDETEVRHLVAVLLDVSNRRRGTLVLIPDDGGRLPNTAGYIDDSELGRTLYQSLEGRKISSLRKERAVVGMLTSDGMTTVAQSGRVLGCGEIVRVEHVDPEEQRAGGGRTQAAMAASRYGLAIKISEDGPISFYKNGREQMQITF